jgi:hypothetical protein
VEANYYINKSKLKDWFENNPFFYSNYTFLSLKSILQVTLVLVSSKFSCIYIVILSLLIFHSNYFFKTPFHYDFRYIYTWIVSAESLILFCITRSVPLEKALSIGMLMAKKHFLLKQRVVFKYEYLSTYLR